MKEIIVNGYTALMILHQMNGKPFSFYSTFYTNPDHSKESKETLVLRSTLCDGPTGGMLSPATGKLQAIVEVMTNNVYFLYIPDPVMGEDWEDCLISPQDIIQIFAKIVASRSKEKTSLMEYALSINEE